MLNFISNQNNVNYSTKSYYIWPTRLVKMKTLVIPRLLNGTIYPLPNSSQRARFLLFPSIRFLKTPSYGGSGLDQGGKTGS